MAKLTQTQGVILKNAARRDDGAILPLPTSITFNKGAAAVVMKSLIRKSLIAEPPGGGDRMAITESGRQAVAAADGTRDAGSQSKRREKRDGTERRRGPRTRPATAAVADRPMSKQATLIALMRRPAGATIEDLAAATGWQAHSVRGAISGTLKKKRGLAVKAAKDQAGARRYRIVEAS